MKTYEKIEIPALEAVNLVCPDGSTRVLEPIRKQKIRLAYDGLGLETVTPEGAPESVVRFWPELPGAYRLNGRTVQVEAGDSHGYIAVSQADPRYFSYADGSPWHPIGTNLTYPGHLRLSNQKEFGQSSQTRSFGLGQYGRWFKRCRENGVNLVRLWLGHEYFNPDTEQIGVFRDTQWSKIEAVIDLAADYGLKVKLTLEQFRFFRYDHDDNSGSYDGHVFRLFNKRLYAGERRCESIREWLTEEVWQEGWLTKVRELAKRIAGNPAVFCIELWNEMNATHPAMAEWNRHMLPKVKTLFPKQLVVNSLGSDAQAERPEYGEAFWGQMPFQQMHRYLDCGSFAEVCHGHPLDFQWDAVQQYATPDKPFLIAETGAVNPNHSGPFFYYNCDHRGIIFCDCVYTPLFAGAAGCGHIWHWDERYLEGKNLYRYFAPLAALTRDIAFDREDFRAERYDQGNLTLLLLRGKNHTLGYLRNRTDNWLHTLRDDQEPISVEREVLPVQLPGQPEVISLWDGETAELICGEKLEVRNLKYGLLFRA